MSMLQEFRGKLGLTDSSPTFWTFAGTALWVAMMYHGYKRNCDSGWWGFGWGLLTPFIWPLALFQGFGKPNPKKCLIARS